VKAAAKAAVVAMHVVKAVAIIVKEAVVVVKDAKVAIMVATAKETVQPVLVSAIFPANAVKTALKDEEDFSLGLVGSALVADQFSLV
jgi:hypothetical protein